MAGPSPQAQGRLRLLPPYHTANWAKRTLCALTGARGLAVSESRWQRPSSQPAVGFRRSEVVRWPADCIRTAARLRQTANAAERLKREYHIAAICLLGCLAGRSPTPTASPGSAELGWVAAVHLRPAAGARDRAEKGSSFAPC